MSRATYANGGMFIVARLLHRRLPMVSVSRASRVSFGTERVKGLAKRSDCSDLRAGAAAPARILEFVRRVTTALAAFPSVVHVGGAARFMLRVNGMRGYSMSRLSLRETQKTVVAEATEIANFLTHREARGNGDTENAMRRLEARYGVPFATFWALRYRKPKDIAGSILTMLRAAYQAECERQRKLLEHEIEIARARGLSSSPLVRAAVRLSCESSHEGKD